MLFFTSASTFVDDLMVKPFIMGTHNSRNMLRIGAAILRAGGSAMDAVEASIKAVELNPQDTSVGLGGIPNVMGIPQLDASIMDGRNLQAGAVAGIKRFKNPISIARKVMEETPHVLLVGEGADQFAEASGFESTELLTTSAKELHKDFLEGKGIVKM